MKVRRPKKNIGFTKETFEIKTTPSGLLSGGNAKSEGQLDEIILSAVQAVAVLKNPVPSPPETSALLGLEGKHSKGKQEEFAFAVRINPKDAAWKVELEGKFKSMELDSYQLELITDLSNQHSSDETKPTPELIYTGSSQLHFELKSAPSLSA